jgi:hypothetical protein
MLTIANVEYCNILLLMLETWVSINFYCQMRELLLNEMSEAQSYEKFRSGTFHTKFWPTILQTMKSCILLKPSQLLSCCLTVVSVNVSEMAGVKTGEPIIVAGRGRRPIKLMNPIGLGRGKQHSSLYTAL